MEPLLIVGLFVLVVGGYIIFTYNTLVTLRVRIKAAIQEIGNQLKRQADLIPNLESSAKGYLKHEKGIFKDLTEARKAVVQAQKTGSLEDTTKAEDLISKVLPRLQMVVESNPEIKGAEVVKNLMDELRDTADKIMYSRRTFIDLVADYNSMRFQVPSNMVANLFSFPEEKGLVSPESGAHLSVTESETKTPKVEL